MKFKLDPAKFTWRGLLLEDIMTLRKLFKLLLILPFIIIYTAHGQSVVHERVEALNSLLGDWNVEQFTYAANGEWQKTSTSKMNMVSGLAGVMISGESRDMMPKGAMDLELTLTYDQFRETYRMSVIDSIYGLMDIYEGDMNSDGHLVLTNIKSDTHFPYENDIMHFRFTFNDDEEGKISFSIEQTSDSGENWSPMLNYVMSQIQ